MQQCDAILLARGHEKQKKNVLKIVRTNVLNLDFIGLAEILLFLSLNRSSMDFTNYFSNDHYCPKRSLLRVIS